MPKKAISMTLGDENLFWLKARAMQKGGNVSAVLDQLVSEARAGHLGTPPAAKSVVGTIDLAADDPELQSGDKAIKDLFARSLSRPMVARESSPTYGSRASRRKTRRG